MTDGTQDEDGMSCFSLTQGLTFMRIDLLKGSKFTVYAVGDEDGHCPVNTFLRQLAKEGNSDAEQLIKRLQSLADGVHLRKEQAHPLEDGFFLVKSSGMSRLIWFYDPTEKAIMVCTHCFRKPASEKYAGEQSRADEIRKSYLAQQNLLQERQQQKVNPKEAGAASKKTKKKK